MAKIILKSRYLKPGSTKHSLNIINYIAKRDGVDKIDDSWKHQPATHSQKKLIETLVEDYPELVSSFEYGDYIKKTTRGNASEFIDRAIEDYIDLAGKRENYVGYIAMRPRVVKNGKHGLFTDDNIPIALSRVAKEVAEHDGNVWTNVVSIRREDAVRLGYDNGEAWRTLLRSNAEIMAKSMKIPLEDLRWYAAFHNESYHPHVHIVAYSVGKEPYLSSKGIEQMKSAFARDIFKQDLMQIYTEQTKRRDELSAKGRTSIEETAERISSGSYKNERLDYLLAELAEQLKSIKGKLMYGYLPKKTKNVVDSIINELEKDERISELYRLWYEQRDDILRVYNDALPDHVPLSQNVEFKSIKNAVIHAALDLKNNSETDGKSEIFDMAYENESKNLNTSSLISALRLLNNVRDILYDKVKDDGNMSCVDRKEIKLIDEKKRAHGMHI